VTTGVGGGQGPFPLEPRLRLPQTDELLRHWESNPRPVKRLQIPGGGPTDAFEARTPAARPLRLTTAISIRPN